MVAIKRAPFNDSPETGRLLKNIEKDKQKLYSRSYPTADSPIDSRPGDQGQGAPKHIRTQDGDSREKVFYRGKK
jgi:hypothetical protein